MGEDVFVEEVGAEHGWVVGVEGDEEAGVEVAADGVFGEGGAASGADVGCDVELDGDLLFGENLEELGSAMTSLPRCGRRERWLELS